MFRIDLEKYPEVKKKLQALLGSKFDLSTLAVFEGLANDTLPIAGAGGLYKNARMTTGYLEGMATKVQNGEFVPIIKLHDQHGSLPVGRIFDAANFTSTVGEDDQDLHILFYIDEKAEPDLSSKLTNGTIAEISTGTTPNSLTCSACGYDFLASADNRKRLWAGKNYEPLCAEGHAWGVGGNHLKLAGLASWKETSAVTRGAVTRAHVLNEKELRLATQTSEINLAAHEDDDKLLLVTLQGDLGGPEFNGSNSPNQDNGNKNMTDISVPRQDYDKLVLAQGKADDLQAKLTAAEGAKTTAEEAKTTAELAQKTAEEAKDTADADLAIANEKVTQLEAQIAVLKNGGGDNGKGVGENGGNGDEKPAEFAMGLDTSYFKVAK